MADVPYTAVQLATMRALRDNDRSMWHLAGHWYFGRPHKAFRKLKLQSIDETPMALLAAIDPLTQVPAGQYMNLAQNRAAWLCSCILWEALFPASLAHFGLIEACRPLLELAAQPEALLAAIDQFTRMPDGSGYHILFSFKCTDCVRMSQGEEGAIEHFEALLRDKTAIAAADLAAEP